MPWNATTIIIQLFAAYLKVNSKLVKMKTPLQTSKYSTLQKCLQKSKKLANKKRFYFVWQCSPNLTIKNVFQICVKKTYHDLHSLDVL